MQSQSPKGKPIIDFYTDDIIWALALSSIAPSKNYLINIRSTNDEVGYITPFEKSDPIAHRSLVVPVPEDQLRYAEHRWALRRNPLLADQTPVLNIFDAASALAEEILYSTNHNIKVQTGYPKLRCNTLGRDISEKVVYFNDGDEPYAKKVAESIYADVQKESNDIENIKSVITSNPLMVVTHGGSLEHLIAYSLVSEFKELLFVAPVILYSNSENPRLNVVNPGIAPLASTSPEDMPVQTIQFFYSKYQEMKQHKFDHHSWLKSMAAQN
jgi:hypothetical protein